MEKVNIEFSPSREQLRQLKSWLQHEHRKTGTGFWCNWEIIESSWENNELVCSLTEGEASALCAWRQSGIFSVLDIVTVRPNLRREGVGRHLVKATLMRLRSHGAIVCNIQCQPRNSEPFWRKLGFTSELVMPQPGHASSPYPKIELAKPLVSRRPVSFERDQNDGILQLWNSIPREAEASPVWKQWNLGAPINGKWALQDPIIHYCNRDWRIHLQRGDEVLYDGNAKNFLKTIEAVKDGYLYISVIDQDTINA